MGGCGCGGSRVAVLGVVCAVITILSLALPTFGAATNPGCSADLSNKVTKFQTGSLKCKSYGFPTSNPYVIWALQDNVTQVATMVVSMPLSPNKWAGIGFSTDGQMVGSTALVTTLSSNGAPIIKVYSLNDRSQQGVVEDASKLTFVGGPPEGHYDQGRTVYISFQVDFTKSTAKANWFLMAFGSLYTDGSIDYHEQRNYFKASIVPGTVVGESAASKLEKKSKIHGSLQILGWGLLLPVGAMVARYARGFDPAWFYVHVTFQILGFACIIAGVATGIQLAKDFQPEHLQAHRGLGLFLFVLAILQVLAVAWRPKKDAKIRKYWNWYHGGVGRLALFLAVVNIFLGLSIGKAENDFKLGYIIILAIELLAFAILEVLLWLRWNRQPRGERSADQGVPGFQFGGSV
ncbi:hypothetical protein KC19_1G155900 [Ceratodon purpureus]|uniref:Cytochrome b561 and DOMON domain-containing protein n=2 Tax=Ceratodon purpureus TaxID=3225 RepID=A0A8T0J7G4_CERPU|nr:hypothetical protein KC19_1G155900 [Ceratodon purpureus]